jgi:pyruvate-formate lyase-activating enzyme
MSTVTTSPAGDYGFGGRLTAGFPSQIVVDITEICNLSCVHCPHPAFKASEHYGARHLDPALNSKLVDEVRHHGRGATQYIRYTSNGEPLVHPQAYDMLDEAVRHSGVYVTLTTNGTIMNEQRTTRLLEAGVHMIDISIDALRPETYTAIRRNGKLAVTRENVLRLLRWVRESRATTKVVVSFVEQPANSAEAADFERFWTDQGADAVVIRRLHSHAGAVVAVADLRRGTAAVTPRRPCLYPWERISLSATGDLAFCPTDWTHRSRLANYRDVTIREMWHGEVYARLRAAHLTDDYGQHAFCGSCPDWALTRWPEEGRSYADMVQEFATAKGRA